jgi:ubiquinone/menaquinone biosynthesis C-methylase UbiE
MAQDSSSHWCTNAMMNSSWMMDKRKTRIMISAMVSLLVVAVILLLQHHHHNHTYFWFSEDLPSPEEVATWDEEKRFNTLYKLSRWESFLSGMQFDRFVRAQVAGLHKNENDTFHFLEVGVGVGAFALELLKMYPLSNGVGIDVVPEAISIANVVLPKDRMKVFTGDMCDMRDFGPSEFDVVYVPGAICYLSSMEEVRSAVAEFYRVLKVRSGICLSMIASDTSAMGSCNTRIPKSFWYKDMVKKYGFKVLNLEEMDDWHLPHSNGRYSVCLQKQE